MGFSLKASLSHHQWQHKLDCSRSSEREKKSEKSALRCQKLTCMWQRNLHKQQIAFVAYTCTFLVMHTLSIMLNRQRDLLCIFLFAIFFWHFFRHFCAHSEYLLRLPPPQRAFSNSLCLYLCKFVSFRLK